MKQYITNGINNSPTIAFPAAADMRDIGGKAVKLNSDNEVVICDTKGEKALGIVTIDNDTEILRNDSVSVQIKDIGPAIIGEDVAALDELTVSETGALVKAGSGDNVIAIALGNYSKGSAGNIQINRYMAAASESENESKTE
ncbi:MAG: hypothetical protein Q4G33_04565 [bacterium]|nr:hypothetical protein [bacterium]